MLTKRKVYRFHQGYFQWVEVGVDEAIEQLPARYRHMVGYAAIDRPPVTWHDWLNRAAALTHWAAELDKDHKSLRQLLKSAARSCLQMLRSSRFTTFN